MNVQHLRSTLAVVAGGAPVECSVDGKKADLTGVGFAHGTVVLSVSVRKADKRADKSPDPHPAAEATA